MLVVGLLGIGGCSGNSSDTLGENHKDLKKVGILQIVEHPSLNNIRESFIKQLSENGYTEGSNLAIDYQNAQGDQSNLKTIAQKFANEKYDLIVAIATPSAQAIAGETKEIPILFAAVTDPVSAGLVNNLEHPGGNITGTSDIISAEQNLKLAFKITPDIKRLGLIYNSGETAALLVTNELKDYLKTSSEKITLIEATVTSTADVPQAVQSLAGKVDAIFAPIDNTIASSMPVVSNMCIDAKIPLYVGADSMVKDGGLAAYGVNYEILGQETADMAAEILNGKQPGDLPIKVMKSLNVYLNSQTATTLGIQIPEEVLKEASEVFGN
ncbi:MULTISPECIES: ABC transporter substrate-binding protein [unclassified Paenibacillus]|nr:MULTISPECIES: ABC transporter substrate-binding protein [unclassified Paenibacillus]MDF9844110.1 putative ABC transport system substrate-binding protein [Paenibacillus sp. PastF-2]MDF9850768.1 putative ABC transport system substrate-binding protein [Paenibacillus sp. PastM-2]